MLQSEYNHVVYQPRLPDDVGANGGDVSQILVNGLCVGWLKERLQRDTGKVISTNIVGLATGSEKLVEAAEVNKRGVECGIMSDGLQRALDLATTETVRDILLVNVERRYLRDDLADNAYGLLKLLCGWNHGHWRRATLAA